MQKIAKDDGFTIIEIMIVLAIAGLILLIVFLAVPALQRNARNTQRRHDAAYIATAREQYDEDNVGSVALVYADAACSAEDSFGTFCGYIMQGLSYYQPSEVTVIDNAYTPPATLPTVTPDTIFSESYLVCNSQNTGATTTGATPYSAVVLFAVESGSGQTEQCIDAALFP